MIKFLIQTFDGIVKHDFSFTLLESIRYHNWLRDEKVFDYRLTDDKIFSNYIPIGSVEFVENYLYKYYIIKFKPLNIPKDLLKEKFTKRNIFNGTERDIIGKKFVKSNDKIKSFAEITDHAPIGNYQISDIIEIDSEWRSFVYEGKLVGLQNYSGEFDIFPNVNLIKEMIAEYKNCPIAYTLDVGINSLSTFVLEAHPMVSVGLYGFSDHKILPYMFSKTFNQIIKEYI
jgi:hypothetical protein